MIQTLPNYNRRRDRVRARLQGVGAGERGMEAAQARRDMWCVSDAASYDHQGILKLYFACPKWVREDELLEAGVRWRGRTDDLNTITEGGTGTEPDCKA